jgi:hypothetical protein
MPLRRTGAAMALVASLGLAACSGGPGAAVAPPSTAGTPASSAPSTGGVPSASTSPSPGLSPSPVATLAPDRCLRGRYALVRFVAVGGSTYGTGQGGDVTVTFDDGRYTLVGAGAEPVVVTVGGQTGNLTVDGRSKGTYTRRGAAATFTTTSASGGGRLGDAAGSATQRITMKQVDSVIGLAGDGQVACTAEAMTITLKAVRLELARD